MQRFLIAGPSYGEPSSSLVYEAVEDHGAMWRVFAGVEANKVMVESGWDKSACTSEP